ncbi:hypothetical protein SBRY_10447 [Actinacidiphila bryophytorum]|uniref:Uncharacterized protein n=1 Tax=Actinacidiphila bryophytorum TaxID=1436133 RepID=A0A9W4E1R6_9ACTN|nr:hypothetical protein SBRY_10447 [Actinacidiphila bryophytorum]
MPTSRASISISTAKAYQPTRPTTTAPTTPCTTAQTMSTIRPTRPDMRSRSAIRATRTAQAIRKRAKSPPPAHDPAAMASGSSPASDISWWRTARPSIQFTKAIVRASSTRTTAVPTAIPLRTVVPLRRPVRARRRLLTGTGPGKARRTTGLRHAVTHRSAVTRQGGPDRKVCAHYSWGFYKRTSAPCGDFERDLPHTR